MSISVKAGRFPGQASTLFIEAGSTVEQVLSLSGIETLKTNEEVKINGVVGTLKTPVTDDNSIIVITTKIKGNADPVAVKVGRFPGNASEYFVSTGTKVSEVLTLAGIDVKTNEEVKLNGVAVDLSAAVVTDPSIIVVTEKIKGNK